MTKLGIGYGVKLRRLIFLPVVRLKNLYVPCRLPVRPRAIAGVDLVTIVLVGVGSL